MAVVFSYTHTGLPDKPRRTLRLRHNPYEVNWTYNLNTQTYPTYAGEVIQVLSVNIDKLTIQGQLGKEGPFGAIASSGQTDPHWRGHVPRGGLRTRNAREQFGYSGT